MEEIIKSKQIACKKCNLSLKIMKLSILMLFICIFSLTAENVYTQQKDLSLDLRNVSLTKAISEIEKTSDYVFLITDEAKMELNKRISISVDKESIHDILKMILKGTGLGYSVVERQVSLYRKEGNNISNTVVAIAEDIEQQKKRITGRVTDNEGIPIIGANIVEEGTTNGTVSDTEGNFILNVTEDAGIQISYIGYLPQRIPTAGRNSFRITLIEDTKALEELVVVGYSTQTRANLTGAVSTVGSEVLQSKPVNNPLSALQGEIPGMLIQRYSGQPGNEEYNMNVRGISSTNGGNVPLVIIDGIAGDINLLGPDDIESISVLKDAQASIYGARAAGGVFLITTKRGKSGTPKISYSGNMAITKSAGMMKSPTNYEMAIMDNEANIHNGATPMYTEDYLNRIRNNDPNPIPHPLYGGWMLFFTNTDWMDELLDNGFQQKHSLSVSGGGEKSNYYLSGGIIDQRGVVKYANDNNKRYNLRINYDYTFFDRVRLETKVSLENQKRTDIGGVGNWVIGEGIFGMPNHPVYNKDGNYFAQGGWGNAVAMAKSGETSTYKTNRVNTNFRLVGDIADGLKLILQAGIIHTAENSKDPAKSTPLYTWENDIAYYSIANPADASLNQASSESTYRNYTGYLQYNNVLAGKHRIDMMAGVAHEENDYEYFAAWRDGYTNNLWSLNLGNSQNMWNTGNGNHWAIGSFFGRMGYAYNERYLFETNLRYDGSSRFSGAEKRWGFFPGISVGWRIKQESFMKDVEFINELKLRASYGETGNQEGIGLYDFIQKISMGDFYPFGAGSQSQSARLDGMVALNRTWETIINRNVGIDASIFQNKLDITFDYFWKKNKDMLIPITYPSLLGAAAPFTNAGELKTKGFEASLEWRDKIGAFNYFARFIMSDAKNIVTYYGGLDTYVLGKNSIRENYPIDSYFAYEFDGLIRTQQELDDYKKLEGVPSNIGIGDAKFKDLNNDGKISTYGTTDDGDVKYVGSATPRYNYGLTLGAEVGGFDLNIFFQGIGQRTLFRVGDYAMPWSDWWRQPAQFYYLQTWNEDRPDAYYPRLSHGDIRYWNYQASTLQKIDASYLRLKNLQIGYTIPENIIKKIALSKARIYLSGQDLWEHHNVKGGWDPESADWGGNYPFQRYYSFGIDITF